MRIGKIRSLTVAFLRLLLTLPLLLALSGGAEGKKPPPVPWTGPVPQADCGPNDRVETGLQGQTSLAERQSGLSELGFNCNLELVGQFQGEGSKYMMDWFDDCAYYGTFNRPEQQHPGVVVVDASDPRNPQATAYLDTPAMLDPHESLKVHQKRKLLAGFRNTTFGPAAGALPPPSGIDIYDVSADCRHPVLKASISIPDSMGHAGNFTPDGMTYYGTVTQQPGLFAIDISDPTQPKLLGDTKHVVHDLSFSKDGTRAYLAQFDNPIPLPIPNGLVIVDVSDYQFRRPNPQARTISTLFWDDGRAAQQTLPVTIRGRPHLIFTDENGRGATACAQGKSPRGFARIIDISDETNPKTISKLMLEVHDPANCPVVLTDPPTSNYSSHYCNVDKAHNPKMVACTYRDAGLRVFDIRDPFHPKEIAYYKPPARRTAFLPGSNLWAPGRDRTVDHTPTQIRWRKHKGETHLWFASQDNGFQIVRFTKSMHELLGKEKGKGKDDDDDDDD